MNQSPRGEPFFFTTDDTSLAVALLTAGVKPAHIEGSTRFVHRRFDAHNPMKRDPRTGKPLANSGRTTYYLDMVAADGHSAGELSDAFFKHRHDLELDEYVDTLPGEIRGKLKKLIPLALMADRYTTLANRKPVLRALNDATPFLNIRRADGSFTLISAERWERATDEEKARILS